MKIQCSCGAKFEFDIAPAMATNPVRFVCPACSVDASEFVDSLVRRELGQSATPAGVPQSILVAATSSPPLPPTLSKASHTAVKVQPKVEDTAGEEEATG